MGQGDCSDPIMLIPPDSITGQIVETEQWFEFEADTAVVYIEISKVASGDFSIDSLILYENDCDSLSLRQYAIALTDSLLWITDSGLVNNTTYKVKITQAANDTSDYELTILRKHTPPSAGVCFVDIGACKNNPFVYATCPGDTVRLYPDISQGCYNYDPDSTVIHWEFLGNHPDVSDTIPFDTIAVVLGPGLNPVTWTAYVYGSGDTVGCAPATHGIFIRDGVAPDFVWLPELVCKNDTICFYSTGPYYPYQGDPLTGEFILWEFGNGDSSLCPTGPPGICDSFACHAYSQAGQYDVQLTISDGICTDSITKTITITSDDSAHFTMEYEGACIPEMVTFYLEAFCLPLDSFLMDFGDGSPYAAATDTMTHSYTTAAWHYPKIRKKHAPGTVVFSDLIILFDVPATPNVTGPTEIECVGDTAVYEITNYDGSNTYAWTVQSGNVIEDKDSTLSVEWTGTPGQVTVQATDGYGCSSDTTINIAITGMPDGGFRVACLDSTCPVDEFAFVPNDTSATHYWDFGDGDTSSQVNPTHTYNNDGTYLVTHIHSNACGNDTVTELVGVNPQCCIDTAECPNIYYFNNPKASSMISLFGSSVITTSATVIITGTLTVDESLAFSNCPDIRMGAFAAIVVNAGYRLEVNQSRIHAACDTMWNGIYLNDFRDTLIVYNNARIADARIAIRSTKRGSFQVMNSKLLDNVVHIDVRDAPEDSVAALIRQSTLSMTDTLRLYPHANEFTRRAIRVHDVKKIKIGDATAAAYENTIERCTTGIHSDSSNIIVVNNYLVNNHPAFPNVVDTAIFVTGGEGGYSAWIGGTGANKSNRAYTWYRGIVAIDLDAWIENDTVYNCDFGIRAQDCLNYLEINDNRIDACDRAIRAMDNNNVDSVIITGNEITRINSNQRGIEVIAPIIASNHTTSVKDNTITGTRYAIFVQNENEPLIENNTITFDAAGSKTPMPAIGSSRGSRPLCAATWPTASNMDLPLRTPYRAPFSS